jgi:aspartate 1-decarboxylase
MPVGGDRYTLAAVAFPPAAANNSPANGTVNSRVSLVCGRSPARRPAGGSRPFPLLSPEQASMLIRVLKSKLHMATVTQTELTYHGSITVAKDLMDAVGLREYEQVLIGNCSNGERAETYVIPGEAGSGAMQLNGAMARLAQPGDRIIVLAFAFAEPREADGIRPQVAILNEHNQIIEKWNG